VVTVISGDHECRVETVTGRPGDGFLLGQRMM